MSIFGETQAIAKAVENTAAIKENQLVHTLNGTPAPGRVWIIPADFSLARVEMWVDVYPSRTGSGFGGWTVVDRDGQKGVTEYTGVDPVRWTMGVRVDGQLAGVNKDAAWRRFFGMSTENKGGIPGPVKLKGTIPDEISEGQWLIETIVPGTSALIDHANRLLGDTATLNLLEPVIETSALHPIAAAQKAAPAATKTITVRPGDTLQKLAAKYLGSASKWHDIANANPIDGHPIRDPDHIPASFKTLKIPAS